MPIRERFSGKTIIEDRLLQMDFTILTYRGDGFTEPTTREMWDESYYLDGIRVDYDDLPEPMQEKCYALSATAERIPFNFGPPDG